MDQQNINNLIVKCYGGSLAYGTNTPSSDVDIRGIFCADKVSIMTPFFSVNEINLKDEQDGKLYELHNFIKLYCDMNPNILELLWVDDSSVLESSAAYEHLKSYRRRLLSKKVAFTFTGYAMQQMKRIKGHNKWINNPQAVESPVRSSFVKLQHNFSSNNIRTQDFSLLDYNNNYKLIPYGNDIYGLIVCAGASTINKDGSIKKFEYETFTDAEKKTHPLMIVKMCEEEYLKAKENHKNYWDWKKNRNETRSALEESFGYDCYSYDTEFLTDNGWKYFDDVASTDKLATFNDAGFVEYHSYSERFDSIYNGNMYHYTGSHYDCYVTANHQMVYRPYERNNLKPTHDYFVKAPASELPKCFQVRATVQPKKRNFILPEELTKFEGITPEQYIAMLGWYISDGTSSTRKEDGRVQASISQSKDSQLMQNAIKMVNQGILKRYQLKETKGGLIENKFTFSPEVSRSLVEDCGHGSKEKRIPSYMFNQSKRHMKMLLINMLYGDGSKRKLKTKDSVYIYHTTSSELADDVQRLSLLCGFVTAKWGPYIADTPFGVSSMYQVHVDMNADPYKILYKDNNLKIIPVKDYRTVCFTVPNHTLITRRNGKISMHGNCKHASHVVRLMRMGVEILSEGSVRVKRPDVAELLDIRNGKWKYEELLEWAEYHDDLVRNKLYKTSFLPKSTDIKLAAKALMETQELIWK